MHRVTIELYYDVMWLVFDAADYTEELLAANWRERYSFFVLQLLHSARLEKLESDIDLLKSNIGWNRLAISAILLNTIVVPVLSELNLAGKRWTPQNAPGSNRDDATVRGYVNRG